MTASTHRCCLIVGSLLAYILAVALNAYLNMPGISPFNVTIGDQSRKYPTGITPSDGTFAIWGLIYLWQLVLVVYCTTLLCRRSGGTPLYISVEFIPSIFFVSYIVNMFGNPAWIVVFLMDMNVKGLVLLLVGVVTLVFCLMSSCVRLDQSYDTMVQKGLQADIWCTRIIVQNGIALYLAWVSCATAINAVVVLSYSLNVSMSTASFGALVVINAIIISWFILETFFYDRQLRYVFAHYITYIIAFVGEYYANYDTSVPYSIYEVALLGLISALALAKIIIIIVRSIKDPIRYPAASKGDEFKFDKLPSADIITVQY